MWKKMIGIEENRFQLNRINPSGGGCQQANLQLAGLTKGFQLNRINPSGGENVCGGVFHPRGREGFQLNRINPSGGVLTYSPRSFFFRTETRFQLNRINPSGGVKFNAWYPSHKESFQLNRINPSGGGKKGYVIGVRGSTEMFPTKPH